ncbi:hypothetical protein S83_051509, partial [Arachis hypogaea]
NLENNRLEGPLPQTLNKPTLEIRLRNYLVTGGQKYQISKVVLGRTVLSLNLEAIISQLQDYYQLL